MADNDPGFSECGKMTENECNIAWRHENSKRGLAENAAQLICSVWQAVALDSPEVFPGTDGSESNAIRPSLSHYLQLPRALSRRSVKLKEKLMAIDFIMELMHAAIPEMA